MVELIKKFINPIGFQENRNFITSYSRLKLIYKDLSEVRSEVLYDTLHPRFPQLCPRAVYLLSLHDGRYLGYARFYQSADRM